MPLDSNGIWLFQESDLISPASDLLNLLAESTSDAIEDVNDRVDALLPETGWTALTLNTPRFALYGSGGDGPVSYTRWGRLVQVHGVVSPGDATAVSAVNGASTSADNRIATLPSGARPNKTITAVMQGSATARWTLNLTSSGDLYANRYGGATLKHVVLDAVRPHVPGARRMSTDPQLVDLTRVLTWPQALVAVVLILAAIVWPGVVSYLNSRAAKQAAEDVRHQVHPNSGKSLRDAVNRIEATQTEQAEVLERVVSRLERLERPRGRWRR